MGMRGVDPTVRCVRCGYDVFVKGRIGKLACRSCWIVDPRTCKALGATNLPRQTKVA